MESSAKSNHPTFTTTKKQTGQSLEKKIDREINLKIPPKNEQEIEDGREYSTKLVQDFAWATTPEPNNKHIVNNYTIEITNKLTEKRKLRRKWKQSRNPIDKTNFNRTIRELEKLIKDFNNDTIQQRLLKLTNTVRIDFSLWNIRK